MRALRRSLVVPYVGAGCAACIQLVQVLLPQPGQPLPIFLVARNLGGNTLFSLPRYCFHGVQSIACRLTLLLSLSASQTTMNSSVGVEHTNKSASSCMVADILPSGVDDGPPTTPEDVLAVEGATPAQTSQPAAVFTVIEPVLTTGVSDSSRTIIVFLLVVANLVQVSFRCCPRSRWTRNIGHTNPALVQFISNFLTLSGGLTLTHALGRETGPGKANWMAASYP